ncbi:MAG: hypothetical protein HY924_07895 [Elusimicrobia bacterium]|nr:hypothetical protein [Elusimicrobiota bacterium]
MILIAACAVLLSCAGARLAAETASAPAPVVGELVSAGRAEAALALADNIGARVDRLERLAAMGGRVEAFIAETKALEKDLRSALRAVNAAATLGEGSARQAAVRLAEASKDVSSRLGKLEGSAPNAAREPLKKVVRRGGWTSRACEKRVAELAVGGSRDPFTEFLIPQPPAETSAESSGTSPGQTAAPR